MKMNAIEWLLFILVIVGGLNWGMVGIADFDLVATIFGEGSGLARTVYSLVGIAAIGLLVSLPMKKKV